MGMITQEAYFRQRVLNYAAKHGVTAAAIQYHMSRKTVHKWKKRYDGTVESLQDLPRTPHHFPRQQTSAELKLVKRYANLRVFVWYMYSCWEYSIRITRSIACFLTGSTSSKPPGNFSSMESMMPGGVQNQGPLIFFLAPTAFVFFLSAVSGAAGIIVLVIFLFSFRCRLPANDFNIDPGKLLCGYLETHPNKSKSWISKAFARKPRLFFS